MIDYHIHTPLCNHARGEMEEYVVSSIKKCLIEICFLDHLIPNDHGKHNSMNIDDIPGYFKEIQRLKNKYSGKIKIKAGLEVDFDPANIGIINEILGQYSFDAIGSSIHFIEGINIASRREAAQSTIQNENYLIGKYFETLYEMLNYDYFDFICHFDVIKKTGRKITNKFTPIIDDIINKIAEKELAVEVNTSGWEHPANECYPSLDIIRKCVDANVPIVLSSDAHKPETVGKDFRKAMKILSSLGCDYISSFEKRTRSFINFTL